MARTPAETRARIERARGDVARAEGEASGLQAGIDEKLAKLRTVLACKAGKEREAIQALREANARGEEEVSALLDEAEAVRDGRTAVEGGEDGEG